MTKASRSVWAAAFLAALLIGGAAAPTFAAVTKEQAARRVAETYGVQVLRVRDGRIDGQPVWLVTVMNPGGDYNEAFMVTTLAVDRQTGELVPAFRHGPSGLAPR